MTLRAFVEPVGVGDTLINMPLFLEPGRYVSVPLEETYRTAFESVPRHCARYSKEDYDVRIVAWYDRNEPSASRVYRIAEKQA